MIPFRYGLHGPGLSRCFSMSSTIFAGLLTLPQLVHSVDHAIASSFCSEVTLLELAGPFYAQLDPNILWSGALGRPRGGSVFIKSMKRRELKSGGKFT